MLKILISFLLAIVASSALAAPPERFQAKLQGGDAGGVAIPTNATGLAKFHVIDDGTAIEYSLKVAGIRNLLMAHIHVAVGPGPIADNEPVGPVVFWFVPTTPPPGSTITDRIQGDIASGLILTNSQIAGPLAFDETDPEGTGVAGLLRAIREGRATVVVHTDDLDPNTPTGVAGDSRAGELRGLIR